MANIGGRFMFFFSVIATCFAVGQLPHMRLVGVFGQLILLNVISQTIIWTFIQPMFFSPLRHIPGPKHGNLLFGHSRQVRLSMPRGEKAREWMETIPNEGLIRFRDLFNREGLIVTTPMTLKTVLNDNAYDYIKQPSTVDALRPVLGDGLVLVEGDVHKFQRKHLQPSFSGHHIRELYPVFWDKACELTHLLGEYVNEPEIELGLWSTRVTLDIIGIAGFGRDFHSLTNHDDPFVADYQEVLEPKPVKALFFALNLIFPYWLISRIPFWYIPRELKRISASLYQFGYNMSRERRAEFAHPKIEDTRKDLLSLLVKSNDFTDHELAHQVLTFLAAGHETTSSTLSWCIYLLAQHPEIQNELRNEIRSSLPSPSTHATLERSVVDDLPYLGAVTNEVLRLYPVVPITSRQTVRETQLLDYKIPEGTNVYIVPWAINRSTTFWCKDAAKFSPRRWINDDLESAREKVNMHGGAKSAFEFMTFLHGPRSCIGQGFARAELKHLIVALIGRYEFTLSRDASTYYPAGIVTSKPAKGMWVKMKRVEGW